MKKPLILPFLFVAVFTCALYAGKSDKPAADDTTNRIDFTAGAGDFTQVSGAAPAASREESQAEPEQESGGGVLGALFGSGEAKKQPPAKNGSVGGGLLNAFGTGGKQKKEVVPEAPEAMGFTFDLMSIARSSIDPFDLDLSFSLLFGDYGNFGLDAIYYLQFLGDDEYFGGTVGLDLAFDIFPLGDSPSGLYFGPIIGGRMYIMGDDMTGAIVPGANAGYRLNLGGFILDVGVIYDAVFTFSDKVKSPINDFQFTFSIGGFTKQITPEMVKAKQQGDKK